MPPLSVTVKYSEPTSNPYHTGPDVTLFLQEDPRYVDQQVRTKIASLFSSYGRSNENLKNILHSVLKSTYDPEKLIATLESFTPTMG